MRKLYILRANEEDGMLVSALRAQGIELDELKFSNPVCPRCSNITLVACAVEGDYELYIWAEMDEEYAAEVDEWYLVCSNLECTWEERVERVTNPIGATLFDLESANLLFDEEVGVGCGSPGRQSALVSYIESLLPYRRTARKLESLLHEAKRGCQETAERVQKWLQRVPPGRMVQITTDDGQVKGCFLTATEHGCLLLGEVGELITVEADSINSYYPRRFDKWGPDEKEPLPDIKEALRRAESDPDALITICGGSYQRVVVRGFELEYQHVDRFGQYICSSRDPKAAEALALHQRHEHCWEGRFLRSDIAMRYDVNRMVRVRGYWVTHYGYTNAKNLAVYTDDREAALALGLREQMPLIFEEEGEPSLSGRMPRWSGVVPRNQVEEAAEVKSWHWPLP